MASKQEWLQICNFRQITGTTLYRSPNLSELPVEEVKKLASLNIQTILDLRWEKDIRSENKPHLDEYFIKMTRNDDSAYLEIDQSIREKLIHEDEAKSGKKKMGFRFCVDFYDLEGMYCFVWNTPWYWRPWHAALYLVDATRGNVYHSFKYICKRYTAPGALSQLLIDQVDVRGSCINESKYQHMLSIISVK